MNTLWLAIRLPDTPSAPELERLACWSGGFTPRVSIAETGLLLRAAPLEEPEPELERKLRRTGLFDYREVLGRNLEALFESQRRRGLA